MVDKQQLEKEMKELCDKVDNYCEGNEACRGCPLNEQNEDSVRAYGIIRGYILKTK